MGSLQGLLNIAIAEEGYIEKASESNLNSKTGNRGVSNYTKYSRDINNWGLMGCQGQPWCATFAFWQEVKEFGVEVALQHWHMTRSTYCGYSCFDTYYSFPPSKRSKKPQLGALVVFKKSHFGRVISVNSNTFKTVEGNTSPQNYDRNGGMVKIKEYSINDSNVKGFLIIDYEDIPNSPSKPDVAKSWIELGDTGSAVNDMQKKLIVCGYSCGSAGADGIFGSGTVNALKAFQKAHGLSVDGQYGKNSKAKLESVYKDKTSEMENGPTSGGLNEIPKWVGEVTASTLKVRSWAGTENKQIKSYPSLNRGNKVDVCDTVKASNGTTWYYIRIAGSIYGFVHSDYIKRF